MLVDTLKKFKALTKRGEHKGKWYCLSCKKNLTDRVDAIPNDCCEYTLVCSGCGSKKYLSAGILATIMIQRTQKEGVLLG